MGTDIMKITGIITRRRKRTGTGIITRRVGGAPVSRPRWAGFQLSPIEGEGQPISTMWTSPGPWTPVMSWYSMSAERLGPVMRFM